jgi:hypothetical protein
VSVCSWGRSTAPQICSSSHAVHRVPRQRGCINFPLPRIFVSQFCDNGERLGARRGEGLGVAPRSEEAAAAVRLVSDHARRQRSRTRHCRSGATASPARRGRPRLAQGLWRLSDLHQYLVIPLFPQFTEHIPYSGVVPLC